MIPEGKHKIFGNIGSNSERPLNVINPVVGKPIVVGDVNNFKLFLTKNHASSTISFALEESPDLFIGFDPNTKILKLVDTEVKWNVQLRTTAFEVNKILQSRVFCWEMNNTAINSSIILGSDLAEPSPPKQKWIFVWIQ